MLADRQIQPGASFTLEQGSDLIKVACCPEDWESVRDEFNMIVKRIEKDAFHHHRDRDAGDEEETKVYMLVYSCILSYTHLLTYALKSPLGNIIYRRDKVQAHLGANNEPVNPLDPVVSSRSTGSAGSKCLIFRNQVRYPATPKHYLVSGLGRKLGDNFDVEFRYMRDTQINMNLTTLFDPARVSSLKGAYEMLATQGTTVRLILRMESARGSYYVDGGSATSLKFIDDVHASSPFPSRAPTRIRPKLSTKGSLLPNLFPPSRASLTPVSPTCTREYKEHEKDDYPDPDSGSIRPGSEGSGSSDGSFFSNPISNVSIPNVPIDDITEVLGPKGVAEPGLDNALRSMLKIAPYLRGKVTLRAELSRIILAGLDKKQIAMNPSGLGPSSSKMSSQAMTKLLDDSMCERKNIHATTVLSTYYTDLKHLLNIRYTAEQMRESGVPQHLCKDIGMWSDTEQHPQASYSFHCIRKGREFIVDIEDRGEARGFSYSIHSHSAVNGKDGLTPIYVHCTSGT